MKSSRLLLVGFLLMTAVGLFAQNVEKTFVRSFNLQGAQELALEFTGAVEVQTWSQTTTRVQMTVGLERGSETMLRSLAQAGRYNLKGQLTDGQYQINVPGLEREVKVNGQSIGEMISYVVFVPENVHVVIDDSTAASAF
jgi:hypothetical protein